MTATQSDIAMRHGSNIGQPMTRRDGVLKVTGAARYSADKHVDGMLYGLVVPSKIANGLVTALDMESAMAVPGVVKILSPDAPPAFSMDPMDKPDGHTFRLHLLQSHAVTYANQPIAFVVATSLEAAREGAAALMPQYQVAVVQQGLESIDEFTPETVGPGFPALAEKGDVEAALASSDFITEQTYETAPQYHNTMEPHAILARWMDDELFLDVPTQAISLTCGRIAGLFGISPEQVHINSEFIGGGFGTKAFISSGQVLAIAAARVVGRPVRFAFPRDQLFGPVGHRAATRQSFRIGTEADGTITAIEHHTRTTSSTFDNFFEPCGTSSRSIYATETMRNSHDVARINSGTPMFMRGPGEASGSIAFESAIDEAAEACGMDPLEFRLKNYAETDPLTGKPFSSKALRDCYRQGADRFGWDERQKAAGSMTAKDGMLVGYGMGTAHFPSLMFAATARATLRADGAVIVELGAHDMGQGISTALPQIAADALGVSMEQIDLRYGTSDQPSAGLGGGSAHTSTAGSSVLKACGDVIAQLADLATGNELSPLFGASNVGVLARNGYLVRRDDESKCESYAEIIRRTGANEIVGHGESGPNAAAQAEFAMYAHGAVFAEIRVDPASYQMRVERMVGAFAIGRVINPRLAESQLIGGMVWGLSFALHEAAEVDRRTGRVVNSNLAEYRIPVNADIKSIEAFTVNENDNYINPLGMKGAGEIGITGTGGAIANAIYHATGKRIRKFPITIADLVN